MPSSHVVLDQVDIAFDDERAVAGAGLLLPATLAERLGVEQVTDQVVDLGDRPGRAHPGRKLLTLVHALVAGGDCIDDVELLRSGATGSVLGHRVMAASTVGTFLRSFTFGHARQLDQVTATILARAWAAGAGPGDGPLTIDVDSTICDVHGDHKQGACYGYTHRLGYHPLLAFRADTGEVLHARLRKGAANTARGIVRFVDELVARLRRAGASGELTLRMDSGFWSAKLIKRLRRHRVRYSITVRQTKTVRAAIAAIPEHHWVDIAYSPGGVAQVAETPYRGDRLVVRRVRNLGDQQQLFATWRYHAFLTDRVGTTVWLDADHRRHAVCELAIRDLKAGAGLAHLPSGQFNANAAWLLAATLAHNLLRWTAILGLGVRKQQTVAKTLRAPCWPCPAGSPAPRGNGRCTCPPAGPGRTHSRWRWPGCAASRTPPDRLRPPRLLIGATPTLPGCAVTGGTREADSPRPPPKHQADAEASTSSPHATYRSHQAPNHPQPASPKPDRWIQAERRALSGGTMDTSRRLDRLPAAALTRRFARPGYPTHEVVAELIADLVTDVAMGTSGAMRNQRPLWRALRGVEPGHQIRSLVLCVDLVGSRRIWPAHVGCLVGPDGSRRIQKDRLDDQTDDQAAGRRVLATQTTTTTGGAGTRYSIW